MHYAMQCNALCNAYKYSGDNLCPALSPAKWAFIFVPKIAAHVIFGSVFAIMLRCDYIAAAIPKSAQIAENGRLRFEIAETAIFCCDSTWPVLQFWQISAIPMRFWRAILTRDFDTRLRHAIPMWTCDSEVRFWHAISTCDLDMRF